VTIDLSIAPISEQHFANINRIVEAHLLEFGRPGRCNNFLEVAAYADLIALSGGMAYAAERKARSATGPLGLTARGRSGTQG
jgi:hypothetical protein